MNEVEITSTRLCGALRSFDFKEILENIWEQNMATQRISSLWFQFSNFIFERYRAKESLIRFFELNEGSDFLRTPVISSNKKGSKDFATICTLSLSYSVFSYFPSLEAKSQSCYFEEVWEGTVCQDCPLKLPRIGSLWNVYTSWRGLNEKVLFVKIAHFNSPAWVPLKFYENRNVSSNSNNILCLYKFL